MLDIWKRPGQPNAVRLSRKRMTAAAGWIGLVIGTLAAIVVAILSRNALGPASIGVLNISVQGASFVAAGAAVVVDILLSIVVSLVTAPKPESELGVWSTH